MPLQYPLQAISLFTTLSSSTSHEYFPENQNNLFTNKLVNPILHDQLSRGLECALTDLYYKPSPTPHRDTIFGHEPDSNKITIVNQLRSDFFVSKNEQKIENFVTHCRLEAKKWGVNIDFKISFTPEGPRFILIQGSEGYNLRMTTVYARSLGFDKEYYTPGQHEAESVFSQALFDLIDVTIRMDFTLFNDKTAIVLVQEPEVKTVSDLISEMNKALTTHNIFFIYDGSNFIFNDENEGRQRTMVELSPFISRVFGVPHPKWFIGKQMKLKSYDNINFGLDSEFLLVKCNVTESQYFHGKLSNILKLIESPNPSSTAFTHVSCVPRVYVPVHNENIENIQITLCDENSRPIEMATNSNTTVVLHFRSRSF